MSHLLPGTHDRGPAGSYRNPGLPHAPPSGSGPALLPQPPSPAHSGALLPPSAFCLPPSAFRLLPLSSSLLKDQPSWVGRWALDYSGLPPPPGEHLKSIDAPVFHRTRRCWLCMGVRSLALNLALSLVTSFPPHLTWEETEAQRGVVISPKVRHLLSGTVRARTQICPVSKPAFTPLCRLCPRLNPGPPLRCKKRAFQVTLDHLSGRAQA